MIGLVTAFEMEAAKVGEDSSIRRMIRLVQSADAGKAKIVGIAMGGVGSDIAVDAADITLATIGTLNPLPARWFRTRSVLVTQTPHSY